MRGLRLCLIALIIIGAAAPANAQDAPSYVTPYIPSKAPSGVGKKAREAAIQFLSAQCTLNEAHRRAVINSNEQANKLIGDARAVLANSAQLFLDVAKNISASMELNPSDREEVRRAYASLGRYDIKKPTSYVAAFLIMRDEIDRDSRQLSDVKFIGSLSDLNTLELMIGLQGRMAEIFVSVTTLTVYGAS